MKQFVLFAGLRSCVVAPKSEATKITSIFKKHKISSQQIGQIVSEGLRVVSVGVNSQALRRGIEKGVEAIVKKIAEISTPVHGNAIEQVASISANDPEIGKMIAEAMKKVSENGVITVEEGQSFGIEVDVVEGMQFDKGYVSPYMVTNSERMEFPY